MVKISAFLLLNAGFIPGITDETLYIISYGEPPCTLYVGQAMGSRGYSVTCRLGRHFGVNIDGCMRQNQRSGASRQFNLMFNKLPDKVKDNFDITLLNVCDIANYGYVDLTASTVRLKMLGSGVTAAEIESNITNSKIVNFCEAALAESLCPTYDRSNNAKCTSGLPESLIKYLLT